MEAPGATLLRIDPFLTTARAAAAARRQLSRPILLHQSIAGEPNCISPSLVCLPVPHLAAGEHAAAVGSKGGGTKGLFVKVLKVLGSYTQKDSY
jgi:hypothetical protein